MSLLANMKSEGLEGQEDRLGGFSLRPTDIYKDAEIKVAYITKSDKGAMALNLSFQIGNGEYRENAIYFTNAAGENFYFTKDSNGNRTTKKAQLPGFNLVNNLCIVALGKELHELDTEKKTFKVWDSEERKELPKSVDAVTELMGAKVAIAIVEQTVNKTEKDDNTGKYVPTAESRDENLIEHVFHNESLATANEVAAYEKAVNDGATPPELGGFAAQWTEKYSGKKRDKRTIKDGASAPQSGRPKAAGGAPQGGQQKATNSLFNRG